MTGEPVQLLVYRFGAGAAFGGELAGALERAEAGGAIRVLDVIVVGRDADSGERFALALHGGRAGGLTSALLSFRLDAGGRAAATRRALAPADERAQLIEELAERLPAGETLIAVLIGHAWARALSGEVTRGDGRELVNAFVEPATLVPLRSELLAAAAQPAA
jgi:hypothetical protein